VFGSAFQSVWAYKMTVTAFWTLTHLVIIFASSSQAMKIGADFRGELLSFPLRENPFFAKVIEIELSYNLNTDGILSNETELGSYNCQVIGDLQCENEQMPVCSGLGVIDCTDDCPGTEEEFKYFREVTEDPDFVTKFPIITGIGKNDKTKNTKKMFLESLTKCKTFSEETLMVIQLAQGGMKFGSDLTHPLELETVTDVEMMPAPTCIVKNMTCSEFPLKSKCRGIGIGRCGSNVDLWKQLFTSKSDFQYFLWWSIHGLVQILDSIQGKIQYVNQFIDVLASLVQNTF